MYVDDFSCCIGEEALEWGVRELRSRAFLEEAECQIAVGNTNEAHHSLQAAEEALLPQHQSSNSSKDLSFPPQRAAIEIFRSRLAFETFEDDCKPSSISTASSVSSSGHRCPGGNKKGCAKTQKAGNVRKGKPACKWRKLLESHLWSLLACMIDIHCIPLLYRSGSTTMPHLPVLQDAALIGCRQADFVGLLLSCLLLLSKQIQETHTVDCLNQKQ